MYYCFWGFRDLNIEQQNKQIMINILHSRKVGTYNLFTVNIFVEISFYQVKRLYVPLTTKWFWRTCKQFGKFWLYLPFKSIFLYDKLYYRGRHLVNETRLFCGCFVQVDTKCAQVRKMILEMLLQNALS